MITRKNQSAKGKVGGWRSNKARAAQQEKKGKSWVVVPGGRGEVGKGIKESLKE